MTDSVFSLECVSYCYPSGELGLDGVSVHIHTGERVAILGANASGKSTLLRLLDGLLFSTLGTVAAFGRELAENSLDGTSFGRFFRQQVSLLFQNVDAQLFCSTVEEELGFGPRHLGLPQVDIERRVEDMLEIFSLRELRSRPPQTLSGGEKKRVGLAAVLAVGPSVVLLDEPTSGLDPRNRASLIDTLFDLGQAGKTLVVATHDLELAGEVAERAVVLGEDHRTAADGPIDEILADPGLLAAVNLIHVHAHRHDRLLHAHPHHHSGRHDHEHE